MWSKTRKALEERLADSLKGRVYYCYAVYDTARNTPCRGSEFRVFYIRVDGATWLASNPLFFSKCLEFEGNCEYATAINVIKTYGMVETGTSLWGSRTDVTRFIYEYLNVLSFEESLYNDNYFIRLLAVLDRRLGKRRLKALLDNIDSETEWFRKWIRLRVEAE